MAACVCTPPDSPDAGQFPPDAGQAPPPPTVTVRLRTVRDPCAALAFASVYRADGGLVGSSDVRGEVGAAEVPAWGELRVASAGTVPTWNALRGLRDGGEVSLLSIPKEAFIFAFSASGLEPSPARGHLVVSVVDERMLPIAGVQVEVDATRGSTTRYVSGGGFFQTFDAGTSATQPHLGLAVVSNVEPGTHGLRLSRAGAPLDEAEVQVHAGEVTFYELVVAGKDGTPAPFFGALTAWPMGGGFGPLRAARTVMHEEATGAEFESYTDDAGVYAFDLPFARRWVDLTVTDPPYGPSRRETVCVQPVTNDWNWVLHVRVLQERLVLARLRGAPFDASKGVVLATTITSPAFDAIAGATVSLGGAPPVAYSNGELTGPCSRGSCGDGGACPSGTRCEGGECLAGQAPLCSRCDAMGRCAGGDVAWFLPNDHFCRCFPSRSDCRAPTPACPAETSCVPMFSAQGDGGLALTPSLCVPAPEDGAGTLTTSTGLGWPAVFTNVDAGEQLLEATAPGRCFAPTRVRVSPGSFVYAQVIGLADGG